VNMPDTNPASHPDSEIEAEILRQIAARPAGSICPTDVARALDENWRPLLGRIRRIAVTLAQHGALEIIRKGRAIAPEEMRGVIRLRLKQEGSA
jgi:hypothetical protein